MFSFVYFIGSNFGGFSQKKVAHLRKRIVGGNGKEGIGIKKGQVGLRAGFLKAWFKEVVV